MFHPNKAINNSRGYLIEFPIKNYKVEQVNMLFSYADTIRGNHYHKVTEEFFFVVNGHAKVTIQNVTTKEESSFIVKKGDSFSVYPYNLHTLDFVEDTLIMSFYSKEFDMNDTDIFTI